ncbi:MAG: alpha-ketoacid dehydrogenase subunit beta [Nanoarchaeota archaeon]
MSKLNIVQALNQAIDQEMAQDPRVLVMGEDVGVDGGVFRVTDGLFKKYGPNRVIDTPLAESGIIATAAGLAINGMKPVAEMQFIGFAFEAFHQIKLHVSCFRQRTSGVFTTSMVIRAPAGGGIKALEHHSESPEAIFTHCQGLKVVYPSNPYDAKGLLVSAIRDPDPVIFLEPERLYRAFKDEVPDELYAVPLGEAKVVREGKDLTIVTYGAMVRLSLEAAEKIAAEGKQVEVIDLRTIFPMDTDRIIQSVKKTGRLVVVHEAPKNAGMGAEISARVQEECLYSLDAPIIRVAAMDTPYPQYALEDYFLPDVNRILRGIKKCLSY